MKRAVTALFFLGWAAVARAQMPDLKSMSGKPLPVADLSPGTVTIRVARQMPANAAVGIDVKATTTAAGAAPKVVTVKTGTDGRATFDGLATGAEFQATLSVDGEALQTARFPIPAQGGTRVMVIAGLGTAPPQEAGDPHAAAPEPFRMGATTGTVDPAPELPKGVLELTIKDHDQKPIANRLVRLGQVKGEVVEVVNAQSDAQGVARWSNLATGEGAAYAAVMEHEGMRLSTEPFKLGTDIGARGDIRALRRTTDTAGLRLDERSLIIFETREDSLVVMERLVFKNQGDTVVDPGEAGLIIPVPSAAKNMQEMPGGSKIELLQRGVALQTTLAPNSAAATAAQAQFGFTIPGDGNGTIEFNQPLPFGLESPFFAVPAAGNLTISAPGIKRLEDRADSAGKPVQRYELPAIAPGGTLALTISGIPAHNRTGARIAGVLSIVMILGGVAFLVGTKPRKSAASKTSRIEAEAQSEAREGLFRELVLVEQKRRQLKGSDPVLDARRQELMAKIEGVYQDLST